MPRFEATDEAQELLEREPELGALQTALESAAAGHGLLLYVDAPGGLGKTRLLDAASALGREAGFEVLSARGSELEREFAFGVAIQLFEGLVSAASPKEREALLGGSPQPLRRLLEGDTEFLDSGSSRADFTLLRALQLLCVRLSERGPLLLLVDDAHWADRLSLRFLNHLVGRLPESVDALQRGLAVAPSGEPSLALELEADHALARMFERSPAPGHPGRLGALVDRHEDAHPATTRALKAALAVELTFEGHQRERAVMLAIESWGDGALIAERTSDDPAIYAVAGTLFLAGQLELSREVLDAALDDARGRGSLSALATASHYRAVLLHHLGCIPDLILDARRAIEAGRTSDNVFLADAHGILALGLLERDDTPEPPRCSPSRRTSSAGSRRPGCTRTSSTPAVRPGSPRAIPAQRSRTSSTAVSCSGRRCGRARPR